MCDFLDRLDDRRLEVEYGPGSVTNGVEAIDKTSDEAVAAGFLRPVDAELIKSRARTSPLLSRLESRLICRLCQLTVSAR